MMKKREGLSCLFAPFDLENDQSYYDAVKGKMNEFIWLLSHNNVSLELQKKSEKFRNRLLNILRNYYKGNIADAQNSMNYVVNHICDSSCSAAVKEVNDCFAFGGDKKDIPFFRARLDAGEEGFRASEMSILPFNMRAKASTERFSMPGLPCLYLGNTSYDCWVEMGKPVDNRFNVSLIILDRTQKLFDLTVTVSSLFNQERDGQNTLKSNLSEELLQRVMLMLCSSFRIKEQNRVFKSEYVIPQLIMLGCKKKGLDGIAYYSSKISNADQFGACAVNVAIYGKYPQNTFRTKDIKADICNHMKIFDAFNFALYMKLIHTSTQSDANEEALWVDRSSWVKKIEAHGEQFSYRDTQFYHFDKFLFTHRGNGYYQTS